MRDNSVGFSAAEEVRAELCGRRWTEAYAMFLNIQTPLERSNYLKLFYIIILLHYLNFSNLAKVCVQVVIVQLL